MYKVFLVILFSVTCLFLQGQEATDNHHNTSTHSSWISCNKSNNPIGDFGITHWLLYDFSDSYSIESMNVWNANHPDRLATGVKRMRLDVSEDGSTWNNMGVMVLEQGTGLNNYEGQLIEDMPSFSARYVLMTILETHGDVCASLAELKFNLGESTTSTVDPVLAAQVSVYPMPNSGTFTVSLGALGSEKINYLLTDVTGATISKGEERPYGIDYEFDIVHNNMEDGTYFLTIHTEKEVVTKKILVINPK